MGGDTRGKISKEMLPSIICGKTFVWAPWDTLEGINFPLERVLLCVVFTERYVKSCKTQMEKAAVMK